MRASLPAGLRPNRRCCLQLGLLSLVANRHGWAQGAEDSPRLYTDKTRAAVERGLQFLQQQQDPQTAHLGSSRHARNAALQALAGMAWLAGGSVPSGGPFAAPLERSVKYLLELATLAGLLVEPDPSPGFGVMYSHGFALLFLAEIYGMSDRGELKGVLNRAVALTAAAQNQAGGWRYEATPGDADVSVTACQLLALRAAASAGIAVPAEVLDRGLAYLLDCYNPQDGGFRYTLQEPASAFSRTAACLTALLLAQARPRDLIAGATAYLQQHRPGTAAGKRIQYYYYGHYYAMQAMWHLGPAALQAWYPVVRDELLAKQDAQHGFWPDDICPHYGTAMACLILQVPLGYLPILLR